MSEVMVEPWADPNAPARRRGEAWRDALSPIFDVRLSDVDMVTAERRLESFNLGPMLFGRVDAPAQILTRGESLCAVGGIDHLLLQYYRTGHSRVRAGGRESEIGPGDCLLIDLSQPIEIEAAEVSAVNLVVPRALIEIGHAADEIHGRALGGPGNPFVDVLTGFMDQADRHIEGLAVGASPEVTGALSNLVKLSLGGGAAGGEPATAGPGNLAQQLAVRRFIAENLADPGLDAELVMRRFGVSRASLYRMFGEVWGVGAYVRNLRLEKARRMLADGVGRARVAQTAYALGFSDEGAFSKTFKRRFGFAPSEIDSRQGPPKDRSGDALADWLRDLAA